MIDYEFQDLFTKQDVDKQLLIEYDTGQLTNHEIHSEQFTLEESLCSDSNLRFGSCEASRVKFTVSNVFEPLKDKWLDISMTLAGNSSNPFKFGRFKVYSDIPTADRKKREITAYDALYDIINADVAAWYNSFFASKTAEDEEVTTTYTLKEFRESFFKHFNLAQEEATLPNDGMAVEKTIEPEQLSGSTVITAICEINGCFGHINRDGKFRYVFLKPINHAIFPSPTLFPSPSLYPVKENGTRITSSKIIPPVKYEDFETDLITGLVIRQEENDIGATAGGGENKYIIEDNFLVYGKNASQLSEIANTVFNQINEIFYRPYEAKSVGNPCIEVGDILRIVTQNKLISSYALQRTFSGVQNLRDEFSADGEKQYAEKVNSLSSSIVQLKGKTNKLTMTVDETISELEDLENGTNTRFEQTSDKISVLATRTTKNEQDITSVNIRADGLSASIQEVDGKVTKNSTKIEANASGLSAEVTRAKEAEASLSVTAKEINISLENFKTDTNSKFTQTSTEISTSVNDLRTETNSKFTQMSNQISLKVESGEVQNMIDLSIEGATIKANQITLEGYTTINGGFSVDESGNVMLKNGSMKAYLSSNAFVVGQTLIGNGVIWTGDVSCSTINSSKPITVANLGDYIGGTSTITYIMSDLSDIWEQLNIRITEDTFSSTLSDYITSSDLTSKLSSYAKTSTLSSYAKKSDLSGYLTSSDLSGYVTTSDLSDTLSSYVKTSTLSGYLTRSEFTAKIETINDNVADNAKLISAMQTGIGQVSARVGTLEEKSSNHTTGINNAMSRIGSLEGRVAALEASL